VFIIVDNESISERSQRLEGQRIRSAQNRMRTPRNFLDFKSAFDYHPETDYLDMYERGSNR